MYLPLFLTLSMEIPRADVYHAVATGYAGILGCMGKHFYPSQLIVSEHGIYTREREEELIRAEWVQRLYKKIWIQQFKKLSLAAYQQADLGTPTHRCGRLFAMTIMALNCRATILLQPLAISMCFITLTATSWQAFRSVIMA